MPQKISGYLKQYPIWSSIGISTLIFGGVWACFGVYYELYESFFTALLSGVLTPGMVYDSLYHMSHLGGFAYIYAHLSAAFPSVPVINLIEYFILISSLSVLLYVYITSAKKINWWTILLIAALSIEYFEMLNCSRVSVLACLASSALLLYMLKNNKPFFSIEGSLLTLFWIIGLFTRVETALFSLSVIIPLFAVIFYSEYQFKIKLRYYSVLIFYVLSVALMSLYITLNSATSDEFYLQIDPKYEAEIMFKKNIVPISNMQNKTDSIRYKAIVNGFWGDAKLNDIHFLASMVNDNKTGFFHLKSISEYQRLLKLFFSHYRMYIISYLLLCIFLLFGNRMVNIRFWSGLAVFQIMILIILIILVIQVKFADRVTVSLLTGSIMLQLLVITLFQKDRANNVLSNLFFVLLPIFFIISHCTRLSQYHSKEIRKNKIEIESNRDIQKAKTIVVSAETIDKILYTRPFQEFSFLQEKKVLLLDLLAMNTIQPYKSYLQNELKCNPEDFSELFPAVERYDPNTLYFLGAKRKTFLRYYLKEIHHLEIANLSE